eukprot:scaffold10615_cov106-Isochrysis_galbana.AAC.6
MTHLPSRRAAASRPAAFGAVPRRLYSPRSTAWRPPAPLVGRIHGRVTGHVPITYAAVGLFQHQHPRRPQRRHAPLRPPADFERRRRATPRRGGVKDHLGGQIQAAEQWRRRGARLGLLVRAPVEQRVVRPQTRHQRHHLPFGWRRQGRAGHASSLGWLAAVCSARGVGLAAWRPENKPEVRRRLHLGRRANQNLLEPAHTRRVGRGLCAAAPNPDGPAADISNAWPTDDPPGPRVAEGPRIWEPTGPTLDAGGVELPPTAGSPLACTAASATDLACASRANSALTPHAVGAATWSGDEDLIPATPQPRRASSLHAKAPPIVPSAAPSSATIAGSTRSPPNIPPPCGPSSSSRFPAAATLVPPSSLSSAPLWETVPELPPALAGTCSSNLLLSPAATTGTSTGATTGTSPAATTGTSPGATIGTSPGATTGTSPGATSGVSPAITRRKCAVTPRTILSSRTPIPTIQAASSLAASSPVTPAACSPSAIHT